MSTCRKISCQAQTLSLKIQNNDMKCLKYTQTSDQPLNYRRVRSYRWEGSSLQYWMARPDPTHMCINIVALSTHIPALPCRLIFDKVDKTVHHWQHRTGQRRDMEAEPSCPNLNSWRAKNIDDSSVHSAYYILNWQRVYFESMMYSTDKNFGYTTTCNSTVYSLITFRAF